MLPNILQFSQAPKMKNSVKHNASRAQAEQAGLLSTALISVRRSSLCLCPVNERGAGVFFYNLPFSAPVSFHTAETDKQAEAIAQV